MFGPWPHCTLIGALTDCGLCDVAGDGGGQRGGSRHGGGDLWPLLQPGARGHGGQQAFPALHQRVQHQHPAVYCQGGQPLLASADPLLATF